MLDNPSVRPEQQHDAAEHAAPPDHDRERGRHESAGPGKGTGKHVLGLTDDALTLDPRAGSVGDWLRDAADRLAGADPGLTQLRTALQAVLSIAVGTVGGYLFVRGTGALQLPAGAAPAAVVAATNHALLVVGMLLAGILAMMAGFTVNDRTLGRQVLSTLTLPIPMIASLGIGLALGPYRIPSLAWLVVLFFIAVYIRRWGPRGFAFGLVSFNGGFFGFFLHTELVPGDLGWLAAIIGVGALASLTVRVLLFRPNQHRMLERMRRSWTVRLGQLIESSLQVLDAPDTEHHARAAKRVNRQLVRLNETTLIVEAQLAVAIPRTADVAARQLFDVELALGNIARFTEALSRLCDDPMLHTQMRVCLTALQREDHQHALVGAEALIAARGKKTRISVLAHRLGYSVRDYVHARQALHSVVEGSEVASFTPAVQLANGFLPGSVPVSAAASTSRGRGGRFNRTILPPYLRSAIQVAVAAIIAILAGDALSGYRLYWALLATFLAFMATTNSGEQARKAFFRVGGTAIGIVAGDVLVHVTGGNVWLSLVFILIALFLGIYLIRVNYTFMVIGITITMSQLYVQFGEFSWGLLLLRLEETAIGVGAVLITVIFILPLRPQRVLTTGAMLWFRSLVAVVDASLDRLTTGASTPLRPVVRQLDVSFDSFEATARPLRRATFGRNSAQLSELRAVAAAARAYVRSLAVEAEQTTLPESTALGAAVRGLKESMGAIDRRIELGEAGRYVRISSLIDLAAPSLPAGNEAGANALRDLTLLDGSLARLATALGMTVADYDTTENVAPSDEPTRAHDRIADPAVLTT